MLNRLYYFVATIGYAGYFPFAPGTVGSALAGVVVFLIKPSELMLMGLIMIFFIAGTISAHNVEKELGKDSGHIIVDEFCGYLVSVLFIPRNMTNLILAFFIFRVFDIVKPPPIRTVEKKVGGGAGVMLDDIVAGIYTNITIQVIYAFFK